ncbi:MAG: hypothetical protein V7K68_16070 [Nostoc sp.]
MSLQPFLVLSPINFRLTRSHFLTQKSNNNHSRLSDRIWQCDI